MTMIVDRAQALLMGALGRIVAVDRRLKKLLAVGLDAFLCVAATLSAFSLRLGEWMLFTEAVFSVIYLTLLCWLPVFVVMGVYRTIFRFVGSGTMLAISRATFIYAIPVVVVCMIVTMPEVPRTIGIIQPILFFLFLCFSRISIRYVLVDLFRQDHVRGSAKRVLIYGANPVGRQLAASIRHEPSMYVAGFIDDGRDMAGQVVDNARIYPSASLADVIRQQKVTDVMLALPDASQAENAQIIRELEPHAVHVRRLPRGVALLDRGPSLDDLREVRLGDLLGREAIAPDGGLLDAAIADKTVLITGAGGSIGGELCVQIVRLRPARIVLVEMSEFALYAIEQKLVGEIARRPELAGITIQCELANATNGDVIRRIFARTKPDAVFHAAAYKHVPLVEANPLGGMHNNIFGTASVAREAAACGVALCVLISTDKAVRPTNVMGATKRVCELVFQAAAHDTPGTVFTMVRFGNVLGSSGSVIPLFERQIRTGGPVTLTHRDVTRYFMTIPEAAQLVIQAGAMARGGEVFVLDMGTPVRIADLASAMIRLSGRTVRDDANPNGDIAIAEVGLRPGEKLYEELLIDADAAPTQHPRIMMANEAMLTPAALAEALDALSRAIQSGDNGAALAVLQQLVPEYCPGPGPAPEAG